MLSGDCSITSGACGREERHSEEAVGSHAEEAALAGPNPLPAYVCSSKRSAAASHLLGTIPHWAAHKGAWHEVVRQASKLSQLGSLRTIHRGLPTNVRRL